MGVIFDEVVTEIEPQSGATGAAPVPPSDTDRNQAVPDEGEVARQIVRLQERMQRLMAD